MAQSCDVCSKTISFGNQKVERGKAKYLGGNGRKTTGISRRVFRPNLQRIKVQEGPRVVTRRVCTSCIRANRVQKAVVRKPFTLPETASK